MEGVGIVPECRKQFDFIIPIELADGDAAAIVVKVKNTVSFDLVDASRDLIAACHELVGVSERRVLPIIINLYHGHLFSGEKSQESNGACLYICPDLAQAKFEEWLPLKITKENSWNKPADLLNSQLP